MASSASSAARVRLPKNQAQQDAAFDRLTSRLEVRGGVLGAIAIAFILHAGVIGSGIAISVLGDLWTWHEALLWKLQGRILDEYQVEIVPEEPEPPKEEAKPEPEPPKEEPKPDTPPPVAEKPTAEQPPPAAAQAAKVLVADPKPDEPLDMTNSIIQGTGDTPVGGRTASNGTSTTAVRNPGAVGGGTPAGTGTVVGATGGGVDKSRPAANNGSSDWDCPFPPEADSLQEDIAFVNIKVMVGADGRPTKVNVVKDPGHGFGREARTCAMQRRFLNALDAAGNPIPGETKEIRVKFER